MNGKGILFALILAAACAAPAAAGFDDSNPNSIIYWSPDDLSSTLIRAEPGDTVTMFCFVNNNNGNYGHSGGTPNWAPAIGYQIGAWWNTDVVEGSTFQWDNGPTYDNGFNGQGDPVSITDKMYDRFAAANWGEWNMFHGEVARYAHFAAWQVQSNRGIYIGQYHPYEYIYENSIVTHFSFTVKADALENVTPTWDPVEQEFYFESPIGLEFAAWNVYGTVGYPELLDGWYNHHEAMTLRVFEAGASTPGDFDSDSDVDVDDINLLCDNMGDSGYDLDGDGDADEDDLVYMVQNLVELTDGSGRTGTELGDFNLDGLINATDLATMNANFGTSSGLGYGDGNANCDDLINATDLAILAANFGYIAPAGAVPEPITLSLLGVGGLALVRRRSR